MVDTPMSAVGRSCFTASAREAQYGTSWANGSLWCCSDDARDLQTLGYEGEGGKEKGGEQGAAREARNLCNPTAKRRRPT